MIRLLDDLSLIEQLSFTEPYIACLFMADGAALLPQPELMNIWVELDDSGKPTAALKVDSEEITLLCGDTPPRAEMLFFISKLIDNGIKYIICSEKISPVLEKLFVSKTETHCIMRCSCPSYCESYNCEIKINSNLDSVFELLNNTVHIAKDVQNNLWMLKMHRGISKNQVTVLSIEKDGKAVSSATIRGRTKGAGAIVSVVTVPEYRGIGLASFLTTECSKILLGEHREPWLVAADEKSQRLYSRLGFTAFEKCFVLYLDEKEKQNE